MNLEDNYPFIESEKDYLTTSEKQLYIKRKR